MKRSPLRKKSRHPRAILKDKAWKAFSLWIRNRDNWICFTCGKRDQSGNMHAGHYIHKDCLDFDERNINAQCVGCNKWRHGNREIYAIRLEAKYGHGILQELYKLGMKTRQFSRQELQELCEKYEE